jgi:hypothetical protein
LIKVAKSVDRDKFIDHKNDLVRALTAHDGIQCPLKLESLDRTITDVVMNLKDITFLTL